MVSNKYDESKLGKAIDLSHHLSLVSAGRKNSPLKEIYRVVEGHTGPLISLAGGMPSPKYFPFETASASALLSSAFSGNSTSTSIEKKTTEPQTTTITIPKYPTSSPEKEPLTLSTLLQYGQASGVSSLNKFLVDHVRDIYKPAYSDWQVHIDCGNTHGTYCAFSLLLNPGDNILVEEFSYPSAMETARSLGVAEFVPIKLDAEGMLPEHLESTLASWPLVGRGRRPRVMYTVTVGQNPTGGTLSLKRRQEIYAICVKYDVIIVEDDPYYFLQMPTYISSAESQKTRSSSKKQSAKDWISDLAPSYLRVDTQGRVIRLDTFSKVIAPGVRCGWITANPLFCERILRHAEVSTQGPSGFSQGMIAKLLTEEWGKDGWYNWLKGLGEVYTSRRDWVCQALEKEFEMDSSLAESQGGWVRIRKTKEVMDEDGWVEVKERRVRRKDLIFFNPPTAGMFIWLGINISLHPKYKSWDYRNDKGEGRRGDNTIELMDELWVLLVNEGDIIVTPGRLFGSTEEMKNKAHFFRIAFSMSEKPELETAMKRLRRTVVKFFES